MKILINAGPCMCSHFNLVFRNMDSGARLPWYKARSSLQAYLVRCVQCVYKNKNESPVLKWGSSHELGQPGLKSSTASLRTEVPGGPRPALLLSGTVAKYKLP